MNHKMSLATESSGQLVGGQQQTGSTKTGSQQEQHPHQHQALFEAIPQSGLKCDILFMVIRNRIQEEAEYVRKLRVVFQFNITKEGKQMATWTCDTKRSIDGDIYRSAPKEGVKPDCILTVDDDDWVKIMVGKLNPQRAFMMSKLRVKGNIMLLQRLYSIWFELRKKGRTPELELIQEIMVNEPLVSGLKSEAMAIELVQRIVRSPKLVSSIEGSLQLNILQQGKLMTQYLLVLPAAGKKAQIRRLYNAQLAQSTTREPPLRRPEVDVSLTMEDDELVLIVYGLDRWRPAVEAGRLLVEGPPEIVERAAMLLEQPVIMSRL